MAYVDFSGDPLHTATFPVAPPAVADDEGRLTGLEWSVVALARGDRLSSLSRPGRMSIALGKVFGTRRHPAHLADPRLEALRRMAVLTWHMSFAVPASEVRAFFAAGFSVAQYETMTESIASARIRHGSHAVKG
ncbi:MAG: hypothetical protein PGN23_08270 [Sphingomonas adhaesiva]|uniref:hypothetical protein n=1 Tax=Sphingomonas adhaesiva TaxID=28212 RepID=UPI002FF4E50A